MSANIKAIDPVCKKRWEDCTCEKGETMTTKHTTGPWKIAYGGAEGDGYFSIGSKEKIKTICESSPYPDQFDEELRANARLIAAAPDLLGACKKALAHLAALDGESAPYNVRVRISLREAIAKAEGKE